MESRKTKDLSKLWRRCVWSFRALEGTLNPKPYTPAFGGFEGLGSGGLAALSFGVWHVDGLSRLGLEI